MLNLAWMDSCIAAGKPFTDLSVARGLVCNPTQSLERKPWGHCRMGTQLTASRHYCFEFDRLLLARDYLALIGHEPSMLDFLEERAARDLVGEAISVQCLASVLYAVVVSANTPGLFERPPP